MTKMTRLLATLARKPRLLGAALAVAAVFAVLPAASAVTPRDGHVETDERNCTEVNEVARVPVAQLREVVPPRYTVRESTATPGIGFVLFVDYVCNDVTVDGKDGWPKPTVTTMGVTVLSARDGQPGFAYYLLWHGTNNPHLRNAFDRMGVTSELMPRNDHIDLVSDGQATVSTSFVGAGLDHHRSVVAPEPPAVPIERSTSATVYHEGTEGETTLYFENRLRPSTMGQSTVTIASTSRIAALGVATTFSQPVAFFRGDWTGHLEASS